MKRLILIDRNGKEAFTLPWTHNPGPWLVYDSRKWGFGTATLEGNWYYYEVL